MKRTFRYLRNLLLPWWLRGGDGDAVSHSLSAVLDAFHARAILGIMAGFPEYCPPDALKYHGRDRKITRGIDESAEGYGARLIPWLDQHRTRGNPFTLLRQLRGYCNVADGMLARTVDRRGNWFTIAADGTQTYAWDTGTWVWDSAAATPNWARGWVILYMTDGELPFAEGPEVGDADLWGGAVGTPGYTVGSTATPEQIAALRSIVSEWKPGGTHAEWIILAFDDASFDPAAPEPDATWGNNWTPRLGTARYVPAVAA